MKPSSDVDLLPTSKLCTSLPECANTQSSCTHGLWVCLGRGFSSIFPGGQLSNMQLVFHELGRSITKCVPHLQHTSCMTDISCQWALYDREHCYTSTCNPEVTADSEDLGVPLYGRSLLPSPACHTWIRWYMMLVPKSTLCRSPHGFAVLARCACSLNRTGSIHCMREITFKVRGPQ